MAAINEAYRVLSDPGRRAVYDRGLAGSARTTATARTGPGGSSPGGPTAAYPGPGAAADPTPARMPWKFMAWMFAVGAAVVLVGAAFVEPAAPARPDGLLQSGSCVEIELNRDAREVTCDGVDDLVVAVLVPLDATCPSGTAAHRDRQGLGIACVRPAEDAVGTVEP